MIPFCVEIMIFLEFLSMVFRNWLNEEVVRLDVYVDRLKGWNPSRISSVLHFLSV
jgi:hypothetical protein